MKNTALPLSVFAIVALSITIFASASLADHHGGGSEHRAHYQEMFQDVTHTVENTDTGVIITMTSEDSEVVAKLQSKTHPEPKYEDVTRTVENIENGIKVTVSTTDEEKVSKIQARAEKMHSGEGKMKRGKFKKHLNSKVSEKGEAFQGKKFIGKKSRTGKLPLDKVEISVEKIENGIVTTITTEDEEVLSKLQSRQARGNETIETIENGVVITKTSENAAFVEALHKKADRYELRSSIDQNIEEIENGIIITLTSDNADAVAKMQAKNPQNKGSVSIVKENIDNGVQVTVTSEKERVVERIQRKAERFAYKSM